MLILALLGLSTNLYCASRGLAKGNLPMVGKFSYQHFTCALFMAHPGVLVTAKHCFIHHDVTPENIILEHLRINFKDNQGKNDDEFRPQIKELVFDSGENDIAYLIFKSNNTQLDFDTKKLNINLDPIPNNIEVLHVGYPSGDKRVVSFECHFFGETDYFSPRITDPGYEGILLNTDCPAWYGDSGGPVFSIDEDDRVQIWGVLSHTFDVDMFGDLLEDRISEDNFGPYIMSSMFSPFSEAVDYQDLIDRSLD